MQALADCRTDHATVVIVTQRRNIVDVADKLMILHAGAIADFGPRAEVMQRQTERMRKAATAQGRPAAPSSAGMPARMLDEWTVVPGSGRKGRSN